MNTAQKETKPNPVNVIGMPGFIDGDAVPDEGPLWIRWILGNSQAYTSFKEDMEIGLREIRKRYRGASFMYGTDRIAGNEDALVDLLARVESYEKEERANVRK